MLAGLASRPTANCFCLLGDVVSPLAQRTCACTVVCGELHTGECFFCFRLRSANMKRAQGVFYFALATLVRRIERAQGCSGALRRDAPGLVTPYNSPHDVIPEWPQGISGIQGISRWFPETGSGKAQKLKAAVGYET